MDVSTESILSGEEKEVLDGLEFPEEVEEALKEVKNSFVNLKHYWTFPMVLKI